MTRPSRDEQSLRTRMPADVDAPDKVVYGLTFRQLAILAVAALGFYGAWQALYGLLATPVLVGAGILLGGLTFGVAVGRRDGLSFDRWLAAAVRHRRAPHALTTTDTTTAAPPWIDTTQARMVLPAPLTLPADAIDGDGQISLGDARAAMVAATSVNLALRTTSEQTALIDTFGRWLNSLSAATQIVVSAQPVDLHSAAHSLAADAGTLPHPALARAAADHAEFLDDLARRRDPLRRQVLIVTRIPGPGLGEHAARRAGDDTARALAGLGVSTRALDGHAATAALAAAADPYRPPRPGTLAAPDTVITGPAPAAPGRPHP